MQHCRLLIPDSTSGHDPRMPDLSGSSVSLSVRAAPNHPGEPDGCTCLCLRRPCWLHPLWKADRSHRCVSRPNRVRFRCGSHRAPHRASTSWLPTAAACSATCFTGISHGELLSAHKRVQAYPDAPESQSRRVAERRRGPAHAESQSRRVAEGAHRTERCAPSASLRLCVSYSSVSRQNPSSS